MANESEQRAVFEVSRRKMLQLAGVLGFTASLGGPASGLAAPRPGRGGVARFQADPTTLTYIASASPADLDPHFANDAASIVAILGFYEGLLALDGAATDKFVGQLAETWSANEDQSTWTFKLRPGILFHDGTPCDANAVVESFKRYLSIGLGALSTRIIPGPDAVSAPDASTVVFTLGLPQPFFESVIAGTYGVFVVNTAVFKANEVDGDYGRAWAQTNAEGAGTGPYKLTQFNPEEQLVMEQFPEYWGGWDGPYFESVVLRVVEENATRRQLLEQGDADLVQSLTYEDIAAFEANPDFTVNKAYSLRVDYFYMSVAGPLATPQARQAMCWAFPYSDVIDGVFRGYAKPARGICAESIYGFDPETFSYTTDLDKAKALLAEAGVPEGTELSCALVSGSENTSTICQLYQANLAEIGITLNITPMDNGSYVGLLYGESPAEERPNMMWWAWWPLYNDAWSHMFDLVMKEAQGPLGGNSGIYFNQQVNDLMRTAEHPVDEESYLKTLAEIQMIVNRDDPPAVYYAQPQQTAITPKSIEGVVQNAVNIQTFYFREMSRATS